MRRHRTRVAALAIVAAFTTLSTAIPATAGTRAAAGPSLAEPTPGAPSKHDPVFPTLGNGGYDVRHYSLDLRIGAVHQPFPASVRINATATQSLSSFDLDFAGNTITSLSVNGVTATYQRVAEKLVITPAKPIWHGDQFQVDVGYTADPTRTGGQHAWVSEPDGFVWSGQPAGAHELFPCDDVPSEKATFDFHVSAPSDLTVVANGSLVGQRSKDSVTEWSYTSRDPIATELAQVAVGHYTVVTSPGPHGLPLRSVVPTSDVAKLKDRLDHVGDQVGWLEGQIGAYPFETYGVLAAPDTFHWALETQTLSLFSSKRLQDPEANIEPIMVHELAHQWFGDSVAPSDWSDVWLNEGHATWYEGTYATYRGWADFDARMKAAYASSNTWRAKFGPPGKPTAKDFFSPDVYDGAALALYALRAKVGKPTFAAIERAWVADHHNGHADTADYIHLASRLSGQDLTDFLADWLYGATVPPMPGHPDWKS
jgi:aminopeptidase N